MTLLEKLKELSATLEEENSDLQRRLDIAKRELCRIHNQDLSDLSSGMDKVFTTFLLRKHYDIMRALQGKPPEEARRGCTAPGRQVLGGEGRGARPWA